LPPKSRNDLPFISTGETLPFVFIAFLAAQYSDCSILSAITISLSAPLAKCRKTSPFAGDFAFLESAILQYLTLKVEKAL
jgi:hypothetical protein